MSVSKVLIRKTTGNSHISSRKAKEREGANPKVSRFPSPFFLRQYYLSMTITDLEVPLMEYPPMHSHSDCTSEDVKQEVNPAPMPIGLFIAILFFKAAPMVALIPYAPTNERMKHTVKCLKELRLFENFEQLNSPTYRRTILCKCGYIYCNRQLSNGAQSTCICLDATFWILYHYLNRLLRVII